jgi:hypothetical protein
MGREKRHLHNADAWAADAAGSDGPDDAGEAGSRVTWWQVRAEFGYGRAVFSVRSEVGEPGAWEAAGERLAKFGQRAVITFLTPIPSPAERRRLRGG